MKRQNWIEFESVLDKYGITKLYHFTDRSNLHSIIQSRGLLSWADCKEKDITIPNPGGDCASRRSDEMSNLHHYVRLSFTNQHPMMFVCRKDGRIHNPVILEIDRSVIYEVSTKFSDMNAVKRDACIGNDLYHFNNIHFKSVTRRCHFDLPYEEQKYFQAEILVENFIPLEKIFNISSFGLQIPPDIQIKQLYGLDTYLYDREAVDFLSECLWLLRHTNYMQGVQLSEYIFEMFDLNNDLQIFIQGILDSSGLFHVVVSKKNEYGICAIPLEHFINILVSLDMFDEGLNDKITRQAISYLWKRKTFIENCIIFGVEKIVFLDSVSSTFDVLKVSEVNPAILAE